MQKCYFRNYTIILLLVILAALGGRGKCSLLLKIRGRRLCHLSRCAQQGNITGAAGTENGNQPSQQIVKKIKEQTKTIFSNEVKNHTNKLI